MALPPGTFGWIGSGFDCQCCTIKAQLKQGVPVDNGYPTSYTQCIFWVLFELHKCGLIDSNQEGVVTSPSAPPTTAVLTGDHLGELYNGPATDIPVLWPARNGETYTLTITDDSYDSECGTKTATLTIPSGTCCAGGLEWLIEISGGVSYSHSATVSSGLLPGTTTASIDSSGLNSSIAKELFIHEYNPGGGPIYEIRLAGEHVYIGDVTSSVSTTRLGGGTLTSTSTFSFYWQFGKRPTSTSWPPPFINTPEYPEARLVARCTAVSVASRVVSGTTYYVVPFNLYEWGIRASLNPATNDVSLFAPYVHFNIGRVFAGNLRTPSSGVYELGLCELIDTGYTYADYGCFKNPSGLNAPFIPVHTDGSNIPDSDGFLIRSIYNIP